MTPDLRDEIKQKKPFRSLTQAAFLNIERTEKVLVDSFETMLKPFGISVTQYNVLRILRGSDGGDGHGLCRNEVRDRLVHRMPDVTRLLDRMEDAGLVKRERSEEDRREVRTLLTKRGKNLVDELDAHVATEHINKLGHLTDEELRTLVRLLEKVRTPEREAK